MTIEFIQENRRTRVISPGTQEVIGMLDGENPIFTVAEVIDPDTMELFHTGMVYQKPNSADRFYGEQINNHPKLRGHVRWVQD